MFMALTRQGDDVATLSSCINSNCYKSRLSILLLWWNKYWTGRTNECFCLTNSKKKVNVTPFFVTVCRFLESFGKCCDGLVAIFRFFLKSVQDHLIKSFGYVWFEGAWWNSFG